MSLRCESDLTNSAFKSRPATGNRRKRCERFRGRRASGGGPSSRRPISSWNKTPSPVLTRFLHANRYPPPDQVRGHASLENALVKLLQLLQAPCPADLGRHRQVLKAALPVGDADLADIDVAF